MKNLLLPSIVDEGENEDLASPFCRFPVSVRQNPIFPIAQQNPELAANLIDRMHARQTDLTDRIDIRQTDLTDRLDARRTDLELRRLQVQEHEASISATADIVRNNAAVLISALRDRPDCDRFTLPHQSESYEEGWLFRSKKRVFRVTSELICHRR